MAALVVSIDPVTPPVMMIVTPDANGLPDMSTCRRQGWARTSRGLNARVVADLPRAAPTPAPPGWTPDGGRLAAAIVLT